MSPFEQVNTKTFHIPTNLHESYSGYILTLWNSNKPASFRNRPKYALHKKR